MLYAAIIGSLLAITGVAYAEQHANVKSASDVLALLQSGEIDLGVNDELLDLGQSKLSVMRTGEYTVYSYAGLDESTDSIALMSYGGKFFYAHFASCSESKTYFNNKARYLSYLLQAR